MLIIIIVIDLLIIIIVINPDCDTWLVPDSQARSLQAPIKAPTCVHCYPCAGKVSLRR